MTTKGQTQSLPAALPGMLRIIRRFRPQIAAQAPLIAGAFVALLVEIAMRLLEPWPLKFIVDYILVPGASTGVALLQSRSPTELVTLAVLAGLAIAGVRALAAYVSTIGFALAGNRVLTDVRGMLYRQIQRQSLAYHSKTKVGDLLTRLTGDIGRLQEVAVTAALPLVANLLTLVGMLAVMCWLNWRLALIAISVVPIFVFSMTSIGERIKSAARRERQREGALAASAAESIGAIKVVQALSLERLMERAFEKRNNQSLSEGVQGRRLSARLERTVDVLVALGSALVLWYGTSLVLGGELLLGDLLVFTSYLKNAFRPMRDLAKYAGRIAKATASGERVIEVLDTTPDVRDLPSARPAPMLHGAVRFDDVSFAYDPQRQALRNFTLDVEPGMRVALVGPSGGGKSTLATMLLRLYDPTSGRVLVDGHDIREYRIESLRRQIAIVLQESVLFSVSVRDNISYGAPHATPAEIEAAARLANAHSFITQLSHGYDTVLGERGATLSGGQRQRIAIARAAIRHAPIVILDEPTTGLDQQNERAVTEALDRLTFGRTTFLIAHDLRTVINADMILYLEQGRVIERGCHADLMAQAGKYAAQHQLQHQKRSRKEVTSALAR